MNIENSLEATTAKFGGFVEAGGMQVRKLQVVGELHLNGINVGGEIGCEFVVIELTRKTILFHLSDGLPLLQIIEHTDYHLQNFQAFLDMMN